MTYCLGILLPTGLVLASDSRSNAGVDQVQRVCKLALMTVPENRVIAIQSQGNLATTQSVVTQLRQAAGSGEAGRDVNLARTMFDVATIVGGKLREVLDQDRKYVEPYGDPSASFLVGGQIAGEAPRLFEIYSAGNFVEATDRSNFLQIGETKYGKPILDRALTPDSSLEHAAKLALLSFDAVYNYAPCLPAAAERHWGTPGAVVGVGLWLAVSFGFRIYLVAVHNYATTYGSLAAVIVLLLWFYLTAFAILAGGEVNSEITRQGPAVRQRRQRRAAPGAPPARGRRRSARA